MTEEYIKKEDTLKMVEQNKNQICIYRAIESLPTYSFPNSAKPEFEKVMDDIHANKGKEVVIVSDSAENKGEWTRHTRVEPVYSIDGVKTWGDKCQCNKCTFTTIVVEGFGYYNFCPNCGADMRGGNK